MVRLPPPIVKEFFAALGKAYTYNIKKNGYAIFGILWGLPVPIATMAVALYFSGLRPTLNNITHIAAYPIHIFFLLHPVMFGIVFGAMGTVREEKERQRLEFENSLLLMNEELKRTNKKLQELDELKDSFLSMVSHELLTPLTTIQGYVSFLKEKRVELPASQQIEALGTIEEEVDHLKGLIEELMDLVKIKANKFEVRLAPIDIGNVVGKVKNMFMHTLESNGLTLEDKLPDHLPLVFADTGRMTQVFSNLLSNAIKFTPVGGRIMLSARINDDKTIFCIEDTGIGIPRESIDKVFDKFYQADSTTRRKYSGCGLGLAITKRIIELHKGHIWVESEKGKGSKFFFELKKNKDCNRQNR